MALQGLAPGVSSCYPARVQTQLHRVGRSDPRARALADRHYSRRTPGAPQFLPPGRALVLMTDDETAMIGFNYAREGYRRDGMRGAEVAIFRNEGSHKSSELIREAIQIARQGWGVESFFTYVDPSKVSSKNPGYCFKKAGFKHTHTTPKGLHLLTLILTTPSP